MPSAVSFQQMQQYGIPTNRISASRLFGLWQVLYVSVKYVFVDLPPGSRPTRRPEAATRRKEPSRYEPNFMAKRETLDSVIKASVKKLSGSWRPHCSQNSQLRRKPIT